VTASIRLEISPAVSNIELNDLFASAWENHRSRDFQPILSRSLLYICAYQEEHLIGFVNAAWDGGVHGFLLDTTVHNAYQRQGVGMRLVQTAVDAARERGIEWVHVDYEPHLDHFYRQCGFQPTLAGLIDLTAG
jgi:GNAT superfamily N-acetyltransferase